MKRYFIGDTMHLDFIEVGQIIKDVKSHQISQIAYIKGSFVKLVNVVSKQITWISTHGVRKGYRSFLTVVRNEK